jgi:hypothetical protein
VAVFFAAGFLAAVFFAAGFFVAFAGIVSSLPIALSRSLFLFYMISFFIAILLCQFVNPLFHFLL